MAKKSKKPQVAAAPPSPAAPAALPWFLRLRVQLGGLFLLACLLYVNTLGHDFALDDAIVITDNVIVQKGIAGWPELFSYDTFYGFFQDESKASLVAGGRYRPLTLALFAVERQLSEGPFLHHLLNVLWYGGLTLVIFLFLRDLARTRPALPWWFALATAALFAAHPLHTEVVANIKGRDEILALLGAVGATLLVWRAAEREWFWGAVAGAGLFFLGCLAKENAITFLAVIPPVLLLFREQGKTGLGRLRYYLPTVVAAAVFLAIRSAVIGFSLGEPVMELLNNPFLELKNGNWVALSGADRLATVMHTLWEYLRLLFVPTGLVHDYYPRAVPVQSWGALTPWLGLLLHLGLAGYALLRWRQRPMVALGILIYLASLSIVSNVFFSVGTNMSERFLFMPSLGWAVALTAGLAALSERCGRGLAWVIPGLVLLFGVATLVRNPVWKDNFTLFTTDVLRQPNSAKLRNAAGGVRIDRYQQLPASSQAANQGLLTAAREDLNAALAIHPTYLNAYLLRGNANLLLKDYDAAIADYERVLAINVDYQAAQDNLLIALVSAGRNAGEERGDLAAAFSYLGRAEQLAPNDYETLRLLGVANGVSGRNDLAVSYFGRAAQVQPANADALWNYGTALYNAGQIEAAQQQFQAAEVIKPGIRAERLGGQ
ncbi:tetratricopeptide repeat protein [Neolewinella lacunae]|uniref:Tetratricopeptide repeat protein n=1 Tax=Neolewinella lacunae TaxID=1517758 RepID=A0A923TA13_9BACT|nr:tetratricopeptide repeat protein [Neolewinella lacunae]MBC6996086.1 tetratricopeptide repeat protein [Neolewinella lacunae]MDN3633939.1 tetratricopeptide repeat protein [Neolewinella lacunae]